MTNHAATETLWGGFLFTVKDILYLWLTMLLFYYVFSMSGLCPGG